MFRVVPDQLRISEGWVRCGHCAEVFDASAHLQSQMAAAALPAEVPPQAQSFATPPLPEMTGAASEETAHGAIVAEEAAAEPEVIAALMQRPALPDEPAALAHEEPVHEEPVREEPVQKAPPAVEEPTESTIEDMSFVREARRKAFWRRPLVRAALGIGCLVLVLVLALQVAVHERDRLAVHEPRAKPWLDELCAPLQCKVAPLRQIESIVIESSAFNKVRGNAYRLSVSVRNKATVPLAMPGIELALTDSQDQPVLRRVLLPADLGATAVIAPGAEWSGSLPVGVAANGQAVRIAGYRLLAFYP